MKPYFAVSLFVTLTVSRCNASEGIYPSTPAPTSGGWNAPVPTTIGGWNAPVPTATVGWNAPLTPTYGTPKQEVPQWERHQDIPQEQPKKYPVEKEQNVFVNSYTKMSPLVGPPKVFVSVQPAPQQGHQININQKQQEEYIATFDRKTTFTQPAPPIIVHQQPKVVDWPNTPVWQIPQAPVVQRVAIHHGSSPFVNPPPQSFPSPYIYPAPQPIPQVQQYSPIPPRFSYGKCMPPRHILDFTWDSVAYRNRGVETFYTPLSHDLTTKSFHKAITGFNLRLTDSLDDVCLTTALNWNDLTAVVTTFGTNKEDYKCSYLSGRTKLALECVPTGNQGGEAFRTYFTKSDDHTYMVAYHCWESGSVEWFTFSNIKILPRRVKHEILRHVESLGFKPDEYKETDYQRCFPDPDVLVPAGETFGSACGIPAHLVQENNWISTNSLNQEIWYIPMAHKTAYSMFNKMINGESLRGNENLKNFCITLNSNIRRGMVMEFYGEVPVSCTNVPNYFRNNRNSWVASCRNNYNEELLTFFVTKTDQRTYRVVKQCWKNGETTWAVYSTQKMLPRHVQDEIRQHVLSLGFNPLDSQEITYDFCTGHIKGHGSEVTRPDEQEEGILGAGSTPALFPQCAPPPSKFIRDFYYDSTLYQLKRTEQFYMPLAGESGFSSIYGFMTGNNFSPSEVNRKGFCSKYELDWRNLDSRFLESAGQTGRMERLNCRLLKSPNSNRDLHAMDCFRENGTPVFRSYTTFTDQTTYFLTKLCWHSGRTTWVLFSSTPTVSRELKQQVLAHVRELGFNSDYQEANYRSCPGEGQIHQQPGAEIQYETGSLGSATALFPRCSPPSSFLRRHTWESSSNNQGIEFFDVAMAHPKAADLYRQSLGQQTNANTQGANGYGFSQNQSPNCLRSRMNYDTNITRHIGYGETVSSDFVCTYAANQEWILECISKSSPWLSYRNYGIKSDNLSWILTYQCLNSAAAPGSWTLWVAPGTYLTQQMKSGIFRTVESLGFNGNDYVEYGSHLCTYKNRLYQQRICDCCTEANARYI